MPALCFTLMKILTIDTSTTCCSVALTDGERLVGELLLNADRKLGGRLIGLVDTLLRESGWSTADLDGFGVALGPGSFTGLRVGVATVKGLALATGKPAVGFSSLAMLALNLPWADAPVCSLFDARKGEVYAGLYSCRELPVPLQPDRVLPPEKLLEELDGPTLFVGEGALRYRELIINRLGDRARFAPSHLHPPRAAAGAMLALQALRVGAVPSLAQLNPFYIRPSEAELALQKKRA